jgi:hypothetical protein
MARGAAAVVNDCKYFRALLGVSQDVWNDDGGDRNTHNKRTHQNSTFSSPHTAREKENKIK